MLVLSRSPTELQMIFDTENFNNDEDSNMLSQKKGSRAQQYKETHKQFLSEFANGLDMLEIGVLLNLSTTQLSRHSLDAYMEHAERVEPKYVCMFWKQLPQQIKKIMPAKDNDLVRIEGDTSGVTITKSPISVKADDHDQVGDLDQDL